MMYMMITLSQRYNTKEIAKVLNVNFRTINRWQKSGLIPIHVHPINGHLSMTGTELLAFYKQLFGEDYDQT